ASSQGYMRYTLFVVRDDTSHSALLVQLSLFTYQAYNLYGGYSLYRGLRPGLTAPPDNTADNDPGVYVSDPRSYAVSFDRPYLDSTGDGGLGIFATYEYNLVRWLERMGYDVTYTTDLDTHARGRLLLAHQLFVAAGHDEYWSTAMRQAVTTARDAGVS